MRKGPPPHDVKELLRNVRGTFPALACETKPDRIRTVVLALFFGIASPLLWAAILFFGENAPAHGWNLENAALSLMIPASIACGWFCWQRCHDKYECSERGIRLLSGGKVRWSVDHAQIEEARMSPYSEHFEMILRCHGRNRSFPLPRALHAAIVRQLENAA